MQKRTFSVNFSITAVNTQFIKSDINNIYIHVVLITWIGMHSSKFYTFVSGVHIVVVQLEHTMYNHVCV